MASELEGRVAIITGGGMGLGQATAELFADHGAKIVIADINPEAGETLVDSLQKRGSEALFVEANVALALDAENMVKKTVKQFGKLDILVNNAGIQVEKRVPDTTEEEWDRVLGVNLKGAFLCSKHAIIEMRKQGSGSIVCVSSLSGLVSNPKQASYNASKHGLIGLAKCMAQDHAMEGIRVNVICPGSMNTPMVLGIPEEHVAPYKLPAALCRADRGRPVYSLPCE